MASTVKNGIDRLRSGNLPRRDAETLEQNPSPRLCTKKTEPETSFCENPSRFPKLLAARHDNELHDIPAINIRSISQEFQNVTPWRLIFDLKTHAYIFKRLLSYVFNQINNFIMVLIETVGQKNKNPRIRDAKKHKKTRFRDSSKTPSRFRDWNKNFRDPEFSGYHSPPLPLHCFLLHVTFY